MSGTAAFLQFVAEMGGEIDVHSNEGAGTCFSITLPRFKHAEPDDTVELF